MPDAPALSRIPILPGRAQSLAVRLGERDYRLRLTWNGAAEGGWVLDVGDAEGVPIVCGIPLLPGQDLLAQYAHLDIGGGGSLFVHGGGTEEAPPTFAGLGEEWQLYFAPFGALLSRDAVASALVLQGLEGAR